jgi:hypothetical protein
MANSWASDLAVTLLGACMPYNSLAITQLQPPHIASEPPSSVFFVFLLRDIIESTTAQKKKDKQRQMQRPHRAGWLASSAATGGSPALAASHSFQAAHMTSVEIAESGRAADWDARFKRGVSKPAPKQAAVPAEMWGLGRAGLADHQQPAVNSHFPM